MAVVNILSIDVEEHFHVHAFSGVIDRRQWDHYESRVVENTQRILRLLDRHQTHATFFILGCVAERFPELVREIHQQGHEIASHGHGHHLVYEQTHDEFREDIRRSLAALTAAIPGVNIHGYRAPSFSITNESNWAWDILVEFGFRYDASVFPTGLHDRYGIAQAPRFAHAVRPQLWEIPSSTIAIAGTNIPVAGGGYFRLYPLWLTRRAIGAINRQLQPTVVYLHPWEFDPRQPRVPGAPLTARFRHYVNLARTEHRLDRLLHEFRFSSIERVFHAQLSHLVPVPGLTL